MNQDAPKSAESSTLAILDSIADGVFTVDLDWRITFLNRAAERIVGVPRDEALGRPCCDVFRASICESACALRQTMETGKPVVNRAVFIMKMDGTSVPISISTALLRDGSGRIIGGAETFRDLSLVEALRKELTKAYSFGDIISKNHRMASLLAILPEVAISDSTVLVTGESGTGKELVARAVHSLSSRKGAPFVPVNCGALPDTLLESELFGHVAGAFTDARRDRKGRFAQAQNGTIFLDEIGNISPAFQVRLLRVLQEREYEPVGASAPVKANVRVVCATNSDLDELVRVGTFRRDLYYRVNVVGLHVPPLRERRDDIPLLVHHFLARQLEEGFAQVSSISGEALRLLVDHAWPGNVRQLETAIKNASLFASGTELVLADFSDLATFEQAPSDLAGLLRSGLDRGMRLKDFEDLLIRQTLELCQGNKKKSAERLGIDRRTLYNRLAAMEPR